MVTATVFVHCTTKCLLVLNLTNAHALVTVLRVKVFLLFIVYFQKTIFPIVLYKMTKHAFQFNYMVLCNVRILFCQCLTRLFTDFMCEMLVICSHMSVT